MEDISGNPIILKIPQSITTKMQIQQIQWIADSSEGVEDGVLDFEMNGQRFTGNFSSLGTDLKNLCLYSAGPFTVPITSHKFTLDVLTTGELVLWLA
jgi:hypothetical protein